MSNKPKPGRLARGMSSHVVRFRKYMDRTFDQIEVTGIEPLLEASEKLQFMITSTHRSHLDYLLLASEMERRGIPRIRFAAGDNLTRLPVLGKRFLAMGAFSVYRGKASQRSYLFKLTDQVKRIILNGDMVVVFPEGGRSYDGHMLDLKSGITGAAVVAQQECDDREICYVPVSISYEVPTEVPYFKMLLSGRTMRDEGKNKLERIWGEFLYYAADAFAFTKRGFLCRFGKDYGKVCIDFGEPIPVKSMTEVQKNFKEKAKNSFLGNRVSIKECADILQGKFSDIYKIWPHNLAAYLITQDATLSLETQGKKIDALVATLEEKKSLFESEKTGVELFREGLTQLKKNNVISLRGDKFKLKRADLLSYFTATVQDKLGEVE